MAKQAAAFVIRVHHAPEFVSGDAWNAIVFGETLVDERVVSREQVEHAPVFAYEAGEEQLRLALHRIRQLLVEIGILQPIWMDLVQILELEPLTGKSWTEGIRASVCQHPPHLLLEHGRIGQLASSRELHQGLVRRRSPEEERQARSQRQIADAVVRTRLNVRRRFLETENKVGTRENGLKGSSDSDLEASVCRTILVERHQGGAIVGREWSPERPRPETRDDLPGARGFFAG